MRSSFSRSLLGFCLALLVSVAQAQSLGPSQPYAYEASASQPPTGLAVLITGGGALGFLDDRSHYQAQAARLRNLGLDTLIVETGAGALMGPSPRSPATDQRHVAPVREAIRWAKSRTQRVQEAPVLLVSWGQGGEAVIRLLADPNAVTELQIRGAVMYYPSNADNLNSPLKRPAIAFFGEADEVTPASRFNAFTLSFGEGTIPLEIVTLPGARHGFDVQSQARARIGRVLPIFGQGTPAPYDNNAAGAAERRAESFVRELLGSR